MPWDQGVLGENVRERQEIQMELTIGNPDENEAAMLTADTESLIYWNQEAKT